MCLEDVQLGRQTQPKITTVTLGTVSTLVAHADPRRRSLHILPPSSGVVWVSVTNPVVAAQGYALTPSSQPLMLLVDQAGENVVREWYAIADQGAPNLTVIETALFRGTEQEIHAV